MHLQLKQEDAVSLHRFRDEGEFMSFKVICQKNNIEVVDTIMEQLLELVEIRNPKHQFSKLEKENQVRNYIQSIPLECYGVWVYYPWLNKLIHILDEEEFIEVRTNRNYYKITPSEQKILRQKSIGVAGLSVGHSSVMGFVMEGLCGEIRIADFDTLSLSNMNRINTSIKNLGLSKASITIRQIAEIDPFVKVKCLYDGINEDNIKGFFNDGNAIDLFVEECDSIAVKLLSRLYARESGIPVIMETSDRGMLDIERFDLDSKLPLLHGLVDEIGFEEACRLSDEKKKTFLSQIIDVENLSERARFSLTEITKSINTWPQLMSDVTFGASVLSKVARMILLGQNIKSGRIYMDTDNYLLNTFDEKNTFIQSH